MAPELPKPIICLFGSKGAGKSSFQKVLRRLIDPAAAELTGLPNDEKEFALQCDRNYLLSFDNLSKISLAQSDLLCTVSTGGAFTKRKLFTNDEEVILRYCRPVTMSGINTVAERSDLLDRCLMVELERIPTTKRTSERIFWGKFDAAKAKILGALFDAVSYALRTPDPELPVLERMADFNEIGYNLAQGLGFVGEAFLEALWANANDTVDTALKASPIALCIFSLVENGKQFEGSSSELYKKLNNVACTMRMGRAFPQSAAALSRALRMMITDLRAAGIEVEEWQDKHLKQTFFKIVKMFPQSPQDLQPNTGAGSGCGEINPYEGEL